jgi:hypothetical protein
MIVSKKECQSIEKDAAVAFISGLEAVIELSLVSFWDGEENCFQ